MLPERQGTFSQISAALPKHGRVILRLVQDMQSLSQTGLVKARYDEEQGIIYTAVDPAAYTVELATAEYRARKIA